MKYVVAFLSIALTVQYSSLIDLRFKLLDRVVAH